MRHDVERKGPKGRALPYTKLGLLLLLAAAILLFLLLGGSEYLTFEQLKGRREFLLAVVEEKPMASALIFAVAYLLIVAFSIPGAAIMTLAAGALFGLVEGTILASISSTAGATLAMLAARFIARDWVKTRFGSALAAIDRGMKRDGDAYLLTLRLAPVFPFFLINLAMGLTKIAPGRFALLTAIGALPGTVAYTAAGTAIANVDSPSEILSPPLIGAFLLLAALPVVGKWVARQLVRRRARQGFRRPHRFDANMLVIGAGSAGLVASLVGRELEAKVILIEHKEMGGDCLNTGCAPSKSLIRAARAAQDLRDAGTFGVSASPPQIDFPQVMNRVNHVIEAIAPNDSVERFQSMGVDVRGGTAKLIDPWTVEIDGRDRLTARTIVIATGAEPVVPPIPGLAESGFVTSESLWSRLLEMEAPARLVVIGGGPIGCELGQALARLGSDVTIVSDAPRLLVREDKEVSTCVEQALTKDGVDIRAGATVTRVGKGAVELDDGSALPFDLLLVAAGRRPRLDGLGLEEIGIDLDTPIARQAREPWPHIRFVGDAAGDVQFTHFAGHSGAIAAINAAAGPFGRLKTDDLVPRVTFTDPNVASVGLVEDQAHRDAISIEVVRYPMDELDRAVIDGSTTGFVKLLVKPRTDRLLGVAIVGPNAGELIMAWVLAMKRGIGLKRMLAAIYPYPTFSEAGRSAASAWRRAHRPERLMALLRRWQAWQRG